MLCGLAFLKRTSSRKPDYSWQPLHINRNNGLSHWKFQSICPAIQLLNISNCWHWSKCNVMMNSLNVCRHGQRMKSFWKLKCGKKRYIQCLELFAEFIPLLLFIFVHCSLLQFDKINLMVSDIPSFSSQDDIRNMLICLENAGRVAAEVIEFSFLYFTFFCFYIWIEFHYFSRSMITSIEK